MPGNKKLPTKKTLHTFSKQGATVENSDKRSLFELEKEQTEVINSLKSFIKLLEESIDAYVQIDSTQKSSNNTFKVPPDRTDEKSVAHEFYIDEEDAKKHTKQKNDAELAELFKYFDIDPNAPKAQDSKQMTDAELSEFMASLEPATNENAAPKANASVEVDPNADYIREFTEIKKILKKQSDSIKFLTMFHFETALPPGKTFAPINEAAQQRQEMEAKGLEQKVSDILEELDVFKQHFFELVDVSKRLEKIFIAIDPGSDVKLGAEGKAEKSSEFGQKIFVMLNTMLDKFSIFLNRLLSVVVKSGNQKYTDEQIKENFKKGIVTTIDEMRKEIQNKWPATNKLTRDN